MARERKSTTRVLGDPVGFSLRVLKGFKANQGLLLAGAVAYYALLSLIPLLILVVVVLSHVIDPARLLAALGQYLDFVVPGQSVLENAMSVIFFHRVRIRRRRFLVSALLPYVFILFLGTGLLIVTIVSGALQRMASRNVVIFGDIVSLEAPSAALLYLLGVVGEILLLTAIYLVMPVGRLSLRHALIGGVTAGLLWEVTRHVVVFYYQTMSQIQVVYGSLTTAIAALLSVEIGAIVLLLGAQVIAEYERAAHEPLDTKPAAMKTDPPRDRR
jgi:YihY family inner membrane protein